jgi:trk system potassium uptake protein TrkH
LDNEQRRPGDRIIRRRVSPTRVISLPEPVGRKEAPSVRRSAKIFITALAVLVVVGAVLLALPFTARSGEATAWEDALFTAMSATAVTGLVVVDTADHWNGFGQFIILVLIQAGGLGFMVGASLVLRMIGRGGGSRLRDALLVQDGAPTVSVREALDLSRKIVRFTFVTEAIGAVVLSVRFARDMPWDQAIWQGMFHAVSAFCNAGFDIQGQFQSLAPYRESIWINLTIMVLIQAGALSYIVLADTAAKWRWSRLATNSRLVLLFNAALVAVGTVSFLIAEWNGAMSDTSMAYRPLVAMFQSVSTRTAGFATEDFTQLSSFTLFVLIGLMFVGGSSGSTAGGVKLQTFGLIVVAVASTVKGQDEPEIFNRRIPIPLVLRALAVATLFFAAHFLVTLSLAATEYLYGVEPTFQALLFEAMSALATVGLSTGITPDLSMPGKLILVAAMFFGRIGPLTAAYALQRRQEVKRYRFPAAHVNIG